MKFIKEMDGALDELDIDKNMAQRYLNEGFSGGEKKRNEILQLMMIQPAIAILDEVDSGLDIDALKVVSKAINDQRKDSFGRSEEHTSELQSRGHLVCRLLLEKKKKY